MTLSILYNINIFSGKLAQDEQHQIAYIKGFNIQIPTWDKLSEGVQTTCNFTMLWSPAFPCTSDRVF